MLDLVREELERLDFRGRLIKNEFGVDETVTMPARHWEYFDWLASQGRDMDKFTADVDAIRNGLPYQIDFGGQLQMQLLADEKRRFLSGEDVQLFISPDGYSPPEEKPFSEQDVPREVINASGETVAIHLPRKYWRYFDWLGTQGTDLAQYIVDADLKSKEQGWKWNTLMGTVRFWLEEDEERRFMSDEESPLFIEPEGYDL